LSTQFSSIADFGIPTQKLEIQIAAWESVSPIDCQYIPKPKSPLNKQAINRHFARVFSGKG
jgi:hypothetical protein